MPTLDFVAYMALLFATAAYGLVYYRRMSHSVQLLAQLILLTLLMEGINFYVAAAYNNNQPTSHLLVLLQIVYLARIFRIELSGLRQKIFTPLSILLLAVAVYQTIDQKMANFPSLQLTLLAFLVIVGSLFSFYQMLLHPVSTPIFRQFNFWFNSGNLIFYGCTFFVFGLMEYMLLQGVGNFPLWSYNVVKICNFLLYASYFWALRSEIQQYNYT